MRHTIRVCSVAAGLMLLGQGCLGGSSQPAKGPDGGVFKSVDRGTAWTQKKVLIEGAKGVSIGDAVVTTLAFDPQDRLSLYAGTEDRGLLTSLDGGDSWQTAKGLPKSRVESVAVDPKDKCTVYVTVANQIYKTVNCGRDWSRAWFDPKTDKVFTRVLVDWFNPTIIYVGSSDGDIFKSTDAAQNFLVAKRAEASVTSIAMDPRDSRAVWVGTKGDGIWKTMDGGQTWLPVKKQLADFDNARRPSQIVIDTQDANMVYEVSKYGILTTKDGGETWTPMQLTSPPNTVEIRSLSVNPRNNQEIQYVTQNALVFSSDGGTTWNSKKLPSARIANVLLTDPQDGKILYLGMGVAPKQN